MTSTRTVPTVGGRRTAHRSPVQLAALVVGALFLVVGVLGFIPGITTNYGDLTFAGHHSTAMLFGLFMVSVLHNIVHLIFGVAGIVMSRSPGSAGLFLMGGGLIYLVLWIYGLVVEQGDATNVVPVNTADNWLHFFLGVAMIALGWTLGGRRARG